jgi:hypothetical protein
MFTSFLLCAILKQLTFFIVLSKKKKSYIVYLGSHEHGEGVTQADFDRVTETHHEFLQSYVGRYVYYNIKGN